MNKSKLLIVFCLSLCTGLEFLGSLTKGAAQKGADVVTGSTGKLTISAYKDAKDFAADVGMDAYNWYCAVWKDRHDVCDADKRDGKDKLDACLDREKENRSIYTKKLTELTTQVDTIPALKAEIDDLKAENEKLKVDLQDSKTDFLREEAKFKRMDSSHNSCQETLRNTMKTYYSYYEEVLGKKKTCEKDLGKKGKELKMVTETCEKDLGKKEKELKMVTEWKDRKVATIVSMERSMNETKEAHKEELASCESRVEKFKGRWHSSKARYNTQKAKYEADITEEQDQCAKRLEQEKARCDLALSEAEETLTEELAVVHGSWSDFGEFGECSTQCGH